MAAHTTCLDSSKQLKPLPTEAAESLEIAMGALEETGETMTGMVSRDALASKPTTTLIKLGSLTILSCRAVCSNQLIR